jgi:hypothetical protein
MLVANQEEPWPALPRSQNHYHQIPYNFAANKYDTTIIASFKTYCCLISKVLLLFRTILDHRTLERAETNWLRLFCASLCDSFTNWRTVWDSPTIRSVFAENKGPNQRLLTRLQDYSLP